MRSIAANHHASIINAGWVRRNRSLYPRSTKGDRRRRAGCVARNRDAAGGGARSRGCKLSGECRIRARIDCRWHSQAADAESRARSAGRGNSECPVASVGQRYGLRRAPAYVDVAEGNARRADGQLRLRCRSRAAECNRKRRTRCVAGDRDAAGDGARGSRRKFCGDGSVCSCIDRHWNGESADAEARARCARCGNCYARRSRIRQSNRN